MKDKGSIGGFFSKHFFVDEEPKLDGTSTSTGTSAAPVTPVPVQAPAPTGRVVTQTSIAQPVVVANTQTQAAVSALNEEMHNGLIKLIEDSNLEGFDYLEFMDSVDKMSAVALPEPDKYRLVFTTAQSFGVTVDTLTQAVEHYLKVLANHKTEFEGHVNSQVGGEVEQRKNRIAALEAETLTLNEQIASISQKIASNTTEASQLSQETIQQELKITQVARDFTATYNHVVSRLTSDKDKISTYLVQ